MDKIHSIKTKYIKMKRQYISINNVSETKKMKTDYVPDQDYINYISIPPLESMAVINVAIKLCMQSDIRDTIRQHSLEFDPIVEGTVRTSRGTFHDRSYKQIEKNIFHILSLLPLPKLLKAKVSNIISPILYQLLEWMRYDRKDIEYLDSISWTNEGTIDKIKTLEQLIDKDTGQHIHSNFKLACKYCLEESIPNLWNKLPEKLKEVYLHGKIIYTEYENHLIAYWIASINNELTALITKFKRSDHKDIYSCNDTLYKNMFKLVLSEGNCLAVKHFWNKLTDIEIRNNLAQWVKCVADSIEFYKGYQHANEYADILYFLLSKLDDKEQQMDVLQQNCVVILNSLFVDWPWQRYFPPTIQVLWKFIDGEVYVKLLSRIVEEIKENKTTEILLRKLWYDSPMNLRKCFIQHVLNVYKGTDVFCILLRVEDMGSINAILNDANIEEKKQIIFALVRKNGTKLRDAIYAGKLSLFGNILIDVLSESDVIRIRDEVVFEHGKKLCHDWICNNNWNMIENFFNWAFTCQEQIDNFKSEIINKVEITYSLLQKGDYELVEKFLNWCFHSEQEIKQFEKYFAKSKPEIAAIGYEDWFAFEKFTAWCFDSEQEMNCFKSDVLRSCAIRREVFSSIAYGYNFDFIEKLIAWCCRSGEEIMQYKAEFVFSDEWMQILQRFVSNYKVYDSEWNNWELIKKLMKLFSPLEDDVITKLKREISMYIEFNEFRPDYKNRSYAITKKDLFRLLDNNSYNMEYGGSSTDDDYDSDVADSDGDDDTCNYDEGSIVVTVLTDMLNKVESDLLGENIL